MPFKARKTKRKIRLTKKQQKDVSAIATKVMRRNMETKTVGKTLENTQLFHNKALYVPNLLSLSRGTGDDNDQSSNACRIGDEVLLRNVNVRFWLSNKNDRPNVMYKLFLFWYNSAVPLADAIVFFTQNNKMIDRINNENVGLIDSKTVFSQSSYSVGVSSVGGSAKEHSYLATLNGNWKGKKIRYNGTNIVPKDRSVGFCVVCYDAFGTLQTDNIASVAYDYVARFQDP